MTSPTVDAAQPPTPLGVEGAARVADAAGPAWPAAGSAWWAVAVLTFAYTVSFVDRTIISLLIDPIKADLGLSDTGVSLLQGLAFGLFYALVGLPLGWAADRLPRRTLIAAGAALWCLATAACGLARNFTQLFVARMAVGIGEAGLSPAAMSLIGDLFPPERRSLPIAIYAAASAIGSGLALIVGGAVISLVARTETVVWPLFGELRAWQAAFVVAGLPGLVIVLLTFTMIDPGRRAPARAERGGAGFISRLSAFRDFYGPHYAAVSVYAILVYGVLSWAPAFFMRRYGWTPAEVGLSYGAVVLVFAGSGPVVGGLVAGWLSRRGRTRANIEAAVLGIVLTGPLLLCAVAIPDGRLSLALFALALVSFSSPGGVVLAALLDATPTAMRGRAAALYYLVVSILGLGVGPLAVALLTDVVFRDPSAVGWSIAIVGCLAGLVSGGLMHLGGRGYERALQ